MVLAGVLLLVGCSTAPSPTASIGSAGQTGPTSWIAMAPGEARVFHGAGGDLVLTYADAAYDIDGTYASALTVEEHGTATTDYFVEQDGTLWWYGCQDSWIAGRNGQVPHEVSIVAGRATFGDLAITVDGDRRPVQVQTSSGVYSS